MKYMVFTIGFLLSSNAFSANPAWKGDCCNASGICMEINATSSKLVLVSDGRGGSLGTTISEIPKKNKQGFSYGAYYFQPPSGKNDGILRLQDDRQFRCFKE